MPHRPPQPDDVRERLQADHWNRLDAQDQLYELRRFVPAVSLGSVRSCGACGRPVAAQETCVACGDETDVAA